MSSRSVSWAEAQNGLDPHTAADREELREHLHRVLSSPAFHNSKRYAAVLRFIVEQTLEGEGARLKERTIGIEVFQRAPDYDTANDHSVRSAVAEVRKRLAQYSVDNPHDSWRIEVVPGSYIPQFRRTAETPPTVPDPSELHQAPAEVRPAPVATLTRAKWLWIAGACFLGLAILAVAIAALRRPDVFDVFWRPILSSRAPVLLCIGNLEGGRGLPSGAAASNAPVTLKDFHQAESETVHVYDAMTLAKFAALIQAGGKKYQLASQSDATFSDLQNGPAILVGLMNNSWTERLVPQLRFTVENPSPHRIVIRDRINPTRSDWSLDYSQPYLDVTKDYAIVLRMVDPKTEQTVVVAAGISVFGTFAAGDFLTRREEMKKLAAIAPRGWEKKNMELVLSTDVIRGRSGPPNIVAAQFW
jgi:hypothetical protein